MSGETYKGVVLVVDDNPMVLRTTRIVISRAGYEVIEATDGLKAIALLESRPDITVLLTDSDMTPMSGAQLACIAQGRRPNLRIICMSGKPEPDLPIGTSFVAKPFSASTLIPRLAIPRSHAAA